MAAIHPRLQTAERRFVLLGASGEDLKKPFETAWQDTANYQYDDPKLSAHSGNYGVCGGYGDLHIVDCDDLERWNELGVLPLIPPTLTIESRPGHRQYYLLCKEHFQSGGLFDPEKTEINEQGKPEYVHIGDVKAGAKDGICGGQAVGPGCKHPSGTIYQVVEDLPIAAVSKEHLQSIISRFKTSKKFNSNYQRAEEQVRTGRKRRYEEKDPLDSLRVVDIMPPAGNVSQSGDELRGDHPVHGSTNGGNYVINTAKNVWHCKRCESGGGAAAAIAVKHGLISCSDATSGELRGDLFKEVLRIAKEKYDMGGRRQEAEEPTEPAIEKAAKNILGCGDVLKFLVHQAQKNHIGDTDVIKHLLASIACTNSLTSSGIQPELNGEKGHGKTDAVKAVFHLIPEKWKLSASISAKALYYHQDLPAGAVIFSDDVQWSEDLISTVKRSMGSFQEPQTHFTLDKNRNPLPHAMPPRLVWWLSSVESVADDQLKDRQYSLDIDEGKDHAKEVSDYLRLSRSKREIRFSVDRGIEISREIVSQIKEHEPFRVVVDCAAAADWKVKEDHRTQNKFWDLVEAFAILRFKQRQIDADRWLHATVEDFNEAKTIFMKRKANHRTHLTNAQTKIVKSVIALQREVDGATQARIAEDLGISQQAVSKGLKAIDANTRFLIHYPGPHGETFYKCTVSGLEVVYGEGDIVTLPDDYNDPQPPFNEDTTIFTTTKTTNNNYKHTTIQPNIEKDSKGDSCDGKVESQDCYARKNGCKVVKSPLDSGSEGFNEVVGKVESTILRFLQAVPAFMGVDLRKHGPYEKEDVATVPSIHAQNLISKGVAVAVIPGRSTA